MAKYLPLLMIVLSIGSAIAYAAQKDWAKSVYWGAAALLTGSTLYM